MEEGQELENKAVEELLKGGGGKGKRGKTRAETMRPTGQRKYPLAGTNRKFLINIIKSTVLAAHKEQEHEQSEDSKEPMKIQDQKEVNPKKLISHPNKHSVHPARGRVGYTSPKETGLPMGQV
uniref:protein POLR1D-like n=1 Tax=Jaculus jaculus TaxID=51337 RepID=UPI001E1B2D63|nr:protein POLR1D-like [Jaculus jaculus]